MFKMSKTAHKIGMSFIAAAFAAAGIGAAQPAQAANQGYGNCSENILNDGIMAWDDNTGRFFYANTKDGYSLYMQEDGAETKLTADECSDINVIGDQVYYVAYGTDIVRLDLTDYAAEMIASVPSGIDEMYVSEQNECYYLSGGDIYMMDAEGNTTSVESEELAIRHFIPVQNGLIYAIGDTRCYSLYANGDWIAGNVFSFYTTDDYLIFESDSQNYQARISDLFCGSASAMVDPYDLGDALDGVQGLAASLEDDDCDECEANALNPVFEDDWYLGLQSLALIDDSVELSAVGATPTKSILNDESVSDGQRNIVKRAYQEHLIEWTPLKSLSSWKNTTTFTAGTTYSGIPYGQPTRNGKYTPWDASLETFADAVADLSSPFYTSRATNGSSTAPYYSCDCSSFVSWAWDLPSRQYTGSIGEYATVVASQSIYSVQIGDAFNLAGSHVCMISDIGYQGDTMVYVDVIEQTPPITKLTRYGEGGVKTLADLNTKYLHRSGSSYVLIRNKTRDSATYTPSSAVLLEGEKGGNLEFVDESLQLSAGETKKPKYKTDATGTPSWSSENTSIATVDSTGVITAVAAGKTTIKLRIGPAKASIDVIVTPAMTTMKTALGISTGGVKVTWKAVPNATGYRVYRKDGDSWTFLKKTTATKYSDIAATLKHNTEYTYTVQAYSIIDGNEYLGIENAVGINGRTVTATPKLLNIAATSYTSQTLTWKPVAGAEGYRVYCIGPEDKDWVRVSEQTETSYLHTGLKTGAKYRYTVRAYFTVKGTKILSWYNEDGIVKKTIPATPVLDSANALSYNSIRVNWKAVEGADFYRIYRKTADSDWVRVDTVKGDVLSLTDKELPTAKTYTYTVRAITMNGKKEIISGYDTAGVSRKINLATPALVSAKSKAAGTMTLTWKAVAGAESYRIYRKTADTEWVRIATVDGNVTSYVDSKLVGGSKHTYTVRALRTEGKVILSGYKKKGITGVVMLNTPVLGNAKTIDRGVTKITWKAVAGAEYYRVYRKSGTNSWEAIDETDGLVLVDGDLDLGVTYTYTVRAVMTVDNKPFLSGYDATGISVNVKLAAPSLVSAYSSSKRAITVNWKQVNSADGYQVYYKEENGSWILAGSVDQDTLTFTKTKLTSGKKYYFTVLAFWEEDGKNYNGNYSRAGIGAEAK